MDEEVWVQLYIGEDKSGEVFSIQPVPKHIDDLKKAVHQAMDTSLGHCNVAHLLVYKAGTQFPSKEEDKLRPSSSVPKDTNDEKPVRVLAPANVNQQGKNFIMLSLPPCYYNSDQLIFHK
jgi:hypothetical protein